ncbi:MAG TPA: glycine cleavage system aminomethyltransferase GcvT [Blastocatellia bacterium]|nr:glycine cleavage system aminomethyltransferase GcvT [Blastocatellia bacterium]
MIRKTPLNDAHRKLGGKMVEFAGWDMPVQYEGPIPEHLAVRNYAGLFDVSHMGEIVVRGNGALALVDYLTINDPKQLKDNQAQYSAMLNHEGGIVDDLLVYRMNATEIFLVVNAGTTKKDFDWIKTNESGFDCEVVDMSAYYAQIAIQGPVAERILQRLTSTPLDKIPSFWSVMGEVAGLEAFISRSGYTGEDGFELYCREADAVRLWNALLLEGTDDGLKPCGLAARNTLRLEAKLMLYGNDIDDTTTPLEAALGWVVKLDKGEFIGRDALVDRPLTRRLVGFEVLDRAPARDGYKVVVDGEQVGTVTSGSPAPYLKKNIGLAYLPVDIAKIGTEIGIVVRERTVPAVVVKTPFYKRQQRFD